MSPQHGFPSRTECPRASVQVLCMSFRAQLSEPRTLENQAKICVRAVLCASFQDVVIPGRRRHPGPENAGCRISMLTEHLHNSSSCAETLRTALIGRCEVNYMDLNLGAIFAFLSTTTQYFWQSLSLHPVTSN
ncbi:hypothetical protein EG328_002422 [Venturia inaequalis]|uniref:Uncharacterized protein n=1 Tax=Venturia inaequalis TaxID=5025 RepID=A0A8H3UWR4_VENIN|nr:hypothetical protein EG328_002422 [Venturia inaequalis]